MLVNLEALGSTIYIDIYIVIYMIIYINNMGRWDPRTMQNAEEYDPKTIFIADNLRR